MPHQPATHYTAYFSQPSSLHPTIHIRLLAAPPSDTAPPLLPTTTTNDDDDDPPRQCTQHILIYLNDRLFLDPYELEDRWGKATVSVSSTNTRQADNERLINAEEETDPWLVVGTRHVAVAADAGNRTITWSLNPQPDLERPVRYTFTRALPAAARIYPYTRRNTSSSPSSSSTGSSYPSNTLSYTALYPPESVLHIIQHPYPEHGSDMYDLEIPVHLRYQEPTPPAHTQTPHTDADADVDGSNTSHANGYRKIILRGVHNIDSSPSPPPDACEQEHNENENSQQTDALVDVYYSCTSPPGPPSSGETLQPRDSNTHPAPAPRQPSTTTHHLRLSCEVQGNPRHTHTHAYTISAPAARQADIAFVPPVTFLCVLLAWLYITRALYRVWKRSRGGRQVVATAAAGVRVGR